MAGRSGLLPGTCRRFGQAILSHTGRATSPGQEASEGKWLFHAGFRKSSELYNIDLLLLDDAARQQVAQTGRVIIVEGPFDVAKLWEAGIRNVVAAFGSNLSADVLPRLAINDIEHTKTKVESPQTNGICERFHKTILQEFYPVTFHKKIYENIDQLQNDLDVWIDHDNNERTHQGKI